MSLVEKSLYTWTYYSLHAWVLYSHITAGALPHNILYSPSIIFGTHILVTDYGTPSTVTFGAGSESVQCVEIPLEEDSLTETCSELFSYQFVSSEQRALLPSPNADIQIIDDDGKLHAPFHSVFTLLASS